MVRAGVTQYTVLAMAAPDACAACTLLQQCAASSSSPGPAQAAAQFPGLLASFSLQRPRQRQSAEPWAWEARRRGPAWSRNAVPVPVPPFCDGLRVRRARQQRQCSAVRASAEGSKDEQGGLEGDVGSGVGAGSGAGDDAHHARPAAEPDAAEGVPSPSGRPTPPGSWWRRPRWNWNWSWAWGGKGNVQVHEVGALLLQLSAVFLLMRMLRPTLPFSARSHSSPAADYTYVAVSFSEFLHRVQRNDVEVVEVDGVHFTYSLKPQAQADKERARAAKVGEVQEGDGRQQLGQGDVVTLAQYALSSPPAKRVVYTTTKPQDVTIPYDKMLENGVEFAAPDKRSLRLINTVSVAILYIGLIAGLLGRIPIRLPTRTTGRMRKGRGGLTGGGSKDRAGTVLFADVAGVDEAKEELEEIVEYLKNPERYSKLGARPPRGILLVGPPGTGKTLLAKAVAGEADVPFISCSASEFVELYVGMGASRVRDLFARAKKDAPSIVFIDEIDAVAKGRDSRLRGMGNDEREQTLNQLLTELDGFESSSTVIVLGATNRADVLDPALRRPGRFDRIVMVEPPDRQGREEILRVHVNKRQLPLAPDVNLQSIASATSGFTGADLANLVNEAALLAGRDRKIQVGKDEFARAVERAIGGVEKKRSTLHGSEKGVVARHEAGHAVVGTAVANLLPEQSRVEKLSILPRSGGALGFTYIPPGTEDRCLLFVDEVRGRLVTLLGGRAAEEVVYSGRVSTGALDDIKRATDVAYKAVAEYGLNPHIGPMSIATLSGGGLDEAGGSFPWAKDQGQMGNIVHREVKSLLQAAMSMALLVIKSNPSVLEGLGAQLEAEEKMEGEALQEWLNRVVAPIELAAFIRGDYSGKAT